MTPEIIRYRIAPERQTAFEQAYAAASTSLQQSEHCLGYELLRSEADASLYLLTIRWTSPEGHLQGFEARRRFGRSRRAG